MEAELVGMSFSDAENRAYYVPVPANRDEALKSSMSSALFTKTKIP